MIVIVVIGFGLCTGYKDIVNMLIHAANSPGQLKRVLDSFDIDGDTVWSPLSLWALFHVLSSEIFVQRCWCLLLSRC